MRATATGWSDALTAAALLAIDPVGLGGICIRSGAGPLRDHWLETLRGLLPEQTPLRKCPPAISDGRLLGGIDLAATLSVGRPVIERGLLAEVNGGILVAVMAERLAASTVAHLNSALDMREIVIERDGLSQRIPSLFAVVALDEGIGDERAAPSICDRIALRVDLTDLSRQDMIGSTFCADQIAAARGRVGKAKLPAHALKALCSTAASLGVASLRAPLFAIRVARAAAALDDDDRVRDAHLELAARLVLAPRATAIPEASSAEAEPAKNREPEGAEQHVPEDAQLDDLVLAAALAAIPPDLLKRLRVGDQDKLRSASVGKQGMSRVSKQRGRPIGVRRGELRSGARLNVLETLRSAAPWQSLRRRTQSQLVGADRAPRLVIHRDDFRVTRFRERSATSTIFVVDASGSSALRRLAEVKGAVELLLADCYVRRDEVALIAFRGKAAELILPPTRSLTRAKRSLAALPGGGGTPLSAAIVSATSLALAVRSKGHCPTIVLMTDGRANVCRDGHSGRTEAESEARDAARQLRVSTIPAVVVDTSPRPQQQAAGIAAEMNARYVVLPYADAAKLSRAIRAHMQA
ncbi:magnesium chelatase subunit D [Bradyrhizobium jicamae]|uniref:magnesium chelatase subunit D n=1 Tax=Bradyrhizobium jicamae TaxID=280332 RepID=UPI001BA79992|nr:magnesium chelatase subunit D [Bradyrhizobium jicamae]MBR0934200.1 magnesium chelatase subunit D [Bradyrhizobium jicamae]